MALLFRSIRSGSSGNVLLLAGERTRLLFDFGLRAKHDCQAVLEVVRREFQEPTGVVISHLHGDHLSSYGLAVLAEQGVPVYLSRKAAGRPGLDALSRAQWFATKPLTIGEFVVQPLPVKHAPGFPNYGFVITTSQASRPRKVCLFTDLCRWSEGLVAQLTDCDFAFLEANHDRELLRRHPNYASRYHLANPHTGLWIRTALHRSHRPPRAIMLGHLSAERNTPELALATVRAAVGGPARFELPPLLVAPRHAESETVIIAE